jgi:glutamate synthase domain-containing protein 3
MDEAKAFHHGIRTDEKALERVFGEWLEQLKNGATPIELDVGGIHYRVVNKLVREGTQRGATSFKLNHINGQRYIGDGLQRPVRIEIFGVPGNDLGAFMNGPEIVVYGNAQDSLANTMNEGKIIVHGDAGDVLGYGMRGGKLYVKGDVGYRVGIHMKDYEEKIPIVIAGGVARDFFGEYQAGGVLILLGLNKEPSDPIVGDYVGTGMHGGVMYIRGEVPQRHLGKEVGERPITNEDEQHLRRLLEEYCSYFDFDLEEVMSQPFTKFVPVSHRPYGKLYTP